MGCTCGKEIVEINGKRYVVIGRIGDGGFSVIDQVEDSRGKTYALKRIKVYSKQDERQASQEAEYHKFMKHPNVLQCIDWTVTQETSKLNYNSKEVLLILPYFKKGTLQDELNRMALKKTHFSEIYLLQFFQQICSAICKFHQSKPVGLVHGDLKPANILIAPDNAPIIMDLGSVGPSLLEVHTTSEARKIQDLAAEKCSMPYRAPELFHVESRTTIDERRDVWSLGCLLFAMCFYKSPFEAAYERGDSIALAVMSGNVHIPEDSPYSQGVHDLILSMLSVNAMERPFIEVVQQSVENQLRNLENQV